MKWEFARTIDAVRSPDLSSKTALEVGAGYGFFLDQLCRAGFSPANIVAIEYNDGAIAELRSRGYAAIASDLRSEDFANKRAEFDFIFMFQVVEHMADLEALFERLSVLLRPGGQVFIAVPNINRTNYQEAHGSLLDMPPNHVSRWTGEAFAKISSRHGLRLVEIEIEPFSFSVFLPMDIRYSHLRRAQELPASSSGLVRRMRRGNARKLLEIAVMLSSIPARLPHWLAAYRQREKMGASLWVKLQKI
nr:class I SAM-dependent methyltransferase [Bradyrhizobium sp. BRP23]